MSAFIGIGPLRDGVRSVGLTWLNPDGKLIASGARDIPDAPDPNDDALLGAVREIAAEIHFGEYTGDIPVSREGIRIGVCEMREGWALFIRT